MEINTDIGFQLLTVIIAFITVTFNVVFSIRENKKKHMIENITRERINDLHKFRELTNALLTMTNVDVLDKASGNNKQKIRNICETSNNLLLLLKPIYEIDRITIQSLKELTFATINFYKGKGKIPLQHIVELNSLFFQHIHLYMYSSWACIKKQVQKGKVFEYEEFESFYNKYKNNFI